MKKYLFTIIALCLGMVQANAQTLSFENAEIPENGKGSIKLKYETGGKTIVGYGFELVLPEGLSVDIVGNEEEGYEPIWTALDGNTGVNLTFQAPASFGFLPKNTASKINESGEYLMSLVLVADETLHQGDEVTVQVKKAMMMERVSETDQQSIKFDDFSFTVKITDSRLVFDETKDAPVFTAGQKYDAKAVRTIKAGNWSSIVLPFSLTAAEYRAIFGDDVHLARLTALNVEFVEGTKEVKNIDLCFTTLPSTSAMAAGRPHIILTSQEKDGAYEISVDGKALQAPKTDQKAEFSEEDEETGDEITINALFVGTYEGATIPANGIFLNSNKFYTSVGKTKTKGLRGWFDVDAAVGQDMSAAKIGFIVDGEPTSVDGIPSYQRITEGVYDLSGRKIQLKDGDLNKLQKGVYIIDGKKVTIK